MTESTELLALKRQKEGYKVIKSLLNVKLSRKLILHTVASSLLTGTRLYEFSRYLEYYLWNTLANSPIAFWNRRNPTFTMAGHFFWHSTSTAETTTPPITEIWSYEWGKLSNHRYLSASWRCRLATKSDQLHFLDLKACNSVSGLKCLFYKQGNDLRFTTSVFSITKPTGSTSERCKWTANLHVSIT